MSSWLFQCNRLDSIMFDAREHSAIVYGVPVSIPALAYLSASAIRWCNDHRDKDASPRDVWEALRIVAGIDRSDRRIATEYEAALRTLTVHAGVYGMHQRPLGRLIARAHLVLEHHWPEGSNHLSDELCRKFGFRIGTAATMATIIVGKSLKNERIDVDELLRHPDLPKILSPEEVTRGAHAFLERISCTRQEVAAFCDAHPHPVNLPVVAAPNPLRERPLFRADHGVLGSHGAAPISRYVMERGTIGLAFDLAECLPNGAFGSSYGKALERYVESLLTRGGREVVREIGFRLDGNRHNGVDFVLFDGTEATLVELKCGGLRDKTWSTGLAGRIDKDIESKLAKALRQLWTFEEAIATSDSDRVRQNDKMFRRLRSASRIHRLVVIEEPLFWGNSLFLDRARRLAQMPDAPDWPVYVASIDDIEYVSTTLHAVSLAEILAAAQEDREREISGFRQWLRPWLHERGIVNEHSFFEVASNAAYRHWGYAESVVSRLESNNASSAEK